MLIPSVINPTFHHDIFTELKFATTHQAPSHKSLLVYTDSPTTIALHSEVTFCININHTTLIPLPSQFKVKSYISIAKEGKKWEFELNLSRK